jgi:protein phosphatase
MAIRSMGLSDVGKVRKKNEDSFLCSDRLGLYVVADGVGGRARGEVASRESVEEIRNWIRRGRQTIDAAVGTLTDASCDEINRLMESAIQHACYMVFGWGQMVPERRGMATTISTLLVVGGAGRQHAFIGQVGDSRVYHWRRGHTTQITEDHTLINYQLKRRMITPAEAAVARGKNVIVRAVGDREFVQVDTFDFPVEPGDRFVLCSDGLHNYIRPGDLAKELSRPLPDACQGLLDLANGRGGADNITVIVVQVGGVMESRSGTLRKLDDGSRAT